MRSLPFLKKHSPMRSGGIYIYLGTYLYLIAEKIKISHIERLVYYLILLEELLTAFAGGSMANLALLFLYLSIILYILGNRMDRIVYFSIVFLSFYYFFAPLKYKYRENISGMARERMNMFWRPSYDASALSLVLDKTPEIVPFWNGETYILLPKFIPRIFWPDKPTEDASLKFAIRYRLVERSRKLSPFPLPILAEMYMNFGKQGVFFGMIILSILYNFFHDIWKYSIIDLVNLSDLPFFSIPAI